MSSDQTRDGLLLLERGGGALELIPGRCFFFSLDDTRKKGREKERKKGGDTEKVKKERKEKKRIKAQAYTT